jgi:hypothetical protein
VRFSCVAAFYRLSGSTTPPSAARAANPQNSQKCHEKPKNLPPRKQCYFTEEQVAEAKNLPPRKQCYFTEEQVAEALRGEGRLSRAAKMLGCCAKTIRETALMTRASISCAGIRLTVPACLGRPCRRAEEI